ncbi:FecR domain-containing protein [Luteimonas sp. FCS-9]|uniref:FecR family protein n=1 Tax=Luteimonas sp. FCS-9 TaxID=1547516 RepID=UPI00063ECB03|nr:FecR domain-containing protein [Luteimonas sp. FCS-9]KLJ00291.1 hypothetical protein WQ56_09455 [Luteimonas sp. FCS-9]
MSASGASHEVTRAAARWHARRHAGGLDAEAQARFAAWLRASPEHVREYLAVTRMAGELSGLLRGSAPSAATARAAASHGTVVPLPPARTSTATRFRSTLPAPRRHRTAMAAVLALGLGLALLAALPRTSEHAAGHGAPRRLALPDGTVVHLNAESALTTRFGLFSRRVELLRGQASFVVAPGRRPFAVHAAGLEVRDIGTTFDVALRRGQARVAVVEGRVQVLDDAGRGPMLADLVAGQRAGIGYRDRRVRVTDEDIGAMTAWWTGRIVFRNEPLRDVADAFNRVSRVRLRIDDAAAGAMRLTGNLRGDDIESLRAFLALQPSLRTRVVDGDIHVATAARLPPR